MSILVVPVTARSGHAAGTSLQWRGCFDGAQCASLPVPLDDTIVGGPTIDIALVRYRADDPDRRIGSLLVNPGGPGASGVDLAVGIADALPSEVRARFDIVGFDPRGVGSSNPVDCTDDLDPIYALDWDPETPDERTALTEGWRTLVAQCQQGAGEVLPYLTTARAARDLDLVRQALGDEQLTYLGYSYGTYLGAWYAEQFPERVRAFVLDGPVDPAIDATKLQVQQSVGFERALRLFLRDCRRDTDCAFHRDGHPGATYDALRARVEAEPLTATDSGTGRTLNGTRFDLGVTQLLYDGRSSWRTLAAALDAADRGDGTELGFYADLYAGRDDDGSYSDAQEAFFAIGCADGPPVGGLEGLQKIEEAAARAAPRLGPAIVNNSYACALWPVAAPQPKVLRARGAPPVLVLGTLDDPATPFVWAEGLARGLSSGVLVSAGGEAHGAFLNGNDCVDAIVVSYVVDLAVPEDGTEC